MRIEEDREELSKEKIGQNNRIFSCNSVAFPFLIHMSRNLGIKSHLTIRGR